MHVVEPWDLWQRYTEPAYLDQAPRPVGDPNLPVDLRLEFAGHMHTRNNAYNDASHETYIKRRQKSAPRFTEYAAQGFDAASQLKAMDVEGIDQAVLFPTKGLLVPWVDGIDPGLATAVCRAYNNWLYDFCQTDPARMKVAAALPQNDPKEAVREARRAVNELGAVGVYMRPNFVNGVTFHAADYQELWATLEELNVPVGFHEGTGSIYRQDGSEFGDNRLMLHACSHPMGMIKAMISMICGGVFENFPKLRAAYLEANAGWVPSWLGRMDRDYELYKEWDAPFLTMKPSEYFARNCFVGTEADEAELHYVVDSSGNQNIVFSSDYPHHDSEFPGSVKDFLTNDKLTDETKRAVLWDNCARLYALG